MSPPQAESSKATTTTTSTIETSAESEPASSSSDSSSPSFPILQNVHKSLQNSWIRQLTSETPQNLERSKLKASLPSYLPLEEVNRIKRPVFNGHYVLVKPTPLNAPRLLLYSPQVAQDLLHLSHQQVQSPQFLSWVSGGNDANFIFGNKDGDDDKTKETSVVEDLEYETWATPYALSIMGTRYTNNCPYGTGDGYGDGRAISIGELYHHELQLKGAGTTPFHRGADGRAVLRSSIREFLASEAMQYLRVPTTRALSLVVSDTDTTRRPWYSEAATSTDSFAALNSRSRPNNNSNRRLPSLDDPRLQNYSMAERKQIIAQLRNSLKDDPNIMMEEKLAITCRVATSFVRVGHVDLFARRAERASMIMANNDADDKTNSRWDTSTNEWKELEQIIWHACYREYRESAYNPFIESNDLAGAATVLLQEAAVKLADMVAHWVRVGFAQGNFNADNCLVGGRTMDYGPFGFMEEYNPLFAKWTGSGNHFGFLNQPSAGFANYQVLVESVVPVICAAKGLEDPTDTMKEFLVPAAQRFQSAVDETLRIKLGFDHQDQDVGDDVWEVLEPLLRSSRVDWTLFFRQLTYIARDFADLTTSTDYDAMMTALEGEDVHSPFYEPLDPETRQSFVAWLKQWKTSLVDSGSAATAYDRMRTANPKYILREWMMVDAYAGAAKGEEAELFNLFHLIQHPYEEGSDHEVAKYYRRAPEETLTMGGTAFMS